MTDYRAFRLNKLNTDEFKHLKLLLYWPVFGLLFMFVERFYPVKNYFEMHCALDDLIPFCEFFVIPYLFWFVFLVGMHLYTLLFDVAGFRKMMKFIMITYTVTIVIYFIFPTCQNLRPPEFIRDNIFTRFLDGFYEFDTNTNVCPSIHVIGTMAVVFAAFHTERFRSWKWKLSFAVVGLLICMSTVMLKQHSILDVIAAVPVCALGYIFSYKIKPRSPKISSNPKAPAEYKELSLCQIL